MLTGPSLSAPSSRAKAPGPGLIGGPAEPLERVISGRRCRLKAEPKKFVCRPPCSPGQLDANHLFGTFFGTLRSGIFRIRDFYSLFVLFEFFSGSLETPIS